MSDQFWHGSQSPRRTLMPGKDGGIHVGTRAQADMRSCAFLHRVSLDVSPTRISRSKDTGGEWERAIKRAKRIGGHAIRYLNRYEGLALNSVLADLDLDGMSDAAFRKAVPEARDSLIVLDPERVRVEEVVPGRGKVTLYHGTSAENAEKLMRDGFDPANTRVGPNGGSSRLLYLTDEPENARWYAERHADGVVVSVRVPASALLVDPEDGVHDTIVEEMLSDLPACLATREKLFGHLIRVHAETPGAYEEFQP